MKQDPEIKRLFGHLKCLVEHCCELTEKLALLSPLASKPIRFSVSKKKYKHKALIEHLRYSLFLSCLIDLSNICFEEDSRVSSLTTLLKKLMDESFRKKLWSYRQGKLDNSVEESDSNMENEFKKLVDLKCKIEKQRLYALLKRIRDKIGAHKEIKCINGEYVFHSVDQDNILHSEIDGFVDLVLGCVEAINVVVSGSTPDLIGRKQRFALDGVDFWSELINPNLPSAP